MDALIVFPHQLFEDSAVRVPATTVYLVEDPLYFALYAFHQQKLVLHRATMQMHAAHLRSVGRTVHYLDGPRVRSMAQVIEILVRDGVTRLHHFELSDDWLERRLKRRAAEQGVDLICHDSPMFLTSAERLRHYFEGPQRLTLGPFYQAQRRALDVLVEAGKPVGGRWSYDTENRRPLPHGHSLPMVHTPAANEYVREAIEYVERQFPNSPGRAAVFAYPVTYDQAQAWLEEFVNDRLVAFGPYEDAIAGQQVVLYHSVLTPMLNIGLLTPLAVLRAVLERTGQIPIASLEGFVRQLIGWREYIHGTYRYRGRRQRTANFFGHQRRIPRRFWSADSGIEPVDAVLRRVLKHGYAHHIERLMVLSSFMLLCEFHPDEVYRFFMELFIDAYDWVMVPNIYGMGQYADGGDMMTKPYLCGSNYILKMSDFKRGPWCAVWDGLYWRFLAKHRARLAETPRLSPVIRGLNRVAPATMLVHIGTADGYLRSLDT